MVRTELYPHVDSFSKWYYKNDPTHVCFYQTETLQWLSTQFKSSLEQTSLSNGFIFKGTEASLRV